MADTDDSRERKLAAKRARYYANREREIARAAQWAKDNRDRNNETRRARYAADPTDIRGAAYAWRDANPEKFAYMKHRQDAKERGVPFLMTFEEWWGVWEASGKWPLRGRSTGEYVMARHGDKGGYEVGNVRICLSTENVSERHQISAKKRRHGPSSL